MTSSPKCQSAGVPTCRSWLYTGRVVELCSLTWSLASSEWVMCRESTTLKISEKFLPVVAGYRMVRRFRLSGPVQWTKPWCRRHVAKRPKMKNKTMFHFLPCFCRLTSCLLRKGHVRASQFCRRCIFPMDPQRRLWVHIIYSQVFCPWAIHSRSVSKHIFAEEPPAYQACLQSLGARQQSREMPTPPGSWQRFIFHDRFASSSSCNWPAESIYSRHVRMLHAFTKNVTLSLLLSSVWALVFQSQHILETLCSNRWWQLTPKHCRLHTFLKSPSTMLCVEQRNHS